MTSARLITPKEARERQLTGLWGETPIKHDVVTEPDQTRAAVVKALRGEAAGLESHVSGHTRENGQIRAGRDIIARIRARADAIENGAPL